MTQVLLAPIKPFLRDLRGTVKVEFVIILPLLLSWLLGSYAVFDAYKSYSRASKATYAVSDIISRKLDVGPSIITEMHDILDGMVPWSSDQKSLRISSLTYDTTNGWSVLWTQHSGITTNFDSNVLQQSTKDILPDLADGDTIILTETAIPYDPLFNSDLVPDLTWRHKLAVRPRYVVSIALAANDGVGDDWTEDISEDTSGEEDDD